MGTSLPILRSLCTNKVQITKTWHTLSAVTLPLTLKWHAQSYLANVASAELVETVPRCCYQGPVNKASSDWPRRLPQQYHPTPVFGRYRSGRLSSCCLRLFLVFLGPSRQMPVGTSVLRRSFPSKSSLIPAATKIEPRTIGIRSDPLSR